MIKSKSEKTKRVTKTQKIIFVIAIAIFLVGLIGSCVTGTTALDGVTKPAPEPLPYESWPLQPAMITH